MCKRGEDEKHFLLIELKTGIMSDFKNLWTIFDERDIACCEYEFSL